MDYTRTCDFIEKYREKESLWNVNSPDYHNKTRRKEMVDELARETSLSVDEVNKKIYNLRTYYQRELRKVQAMKSEQGAEDHCSSKWPFFPLLSFLQDIVTKRKSHGSFDLDAKSMWLTTPNSMNMFPGASNNIDDGATTSVFAFKQEEIGEEQAELSQASKSKKLKEDSQSESNGLGSANQARGKGEDADEAFGRIVAHWLRCAPREIQEDLKLGIHVMCYHAIKHGSVPSFDLSTNSF